MRPPEHGGLVGQHLAVKAEKPDDRPATGQCLLQARVVVCSKVGLEPDYHWGLWRCSLGQRAILASLHSTSGILWLCTHQLQCHLIALVWTVLMLLLTSHNRGTVSQRLLLVVKKSLSTVAASSTLAERPRASSATTEAHIPQEVVPCKLMRTSDPGPCSAAAHEGTWQRSAWHGLAWLQDAECRAVERTPRCDN